MAKCTVCRGSLPDSPSAVWLQWLVYQARVFVKIASHHSDLSGRSQSIRRQISLMRRLKLLIASTGSSCCRLAAMRIFVKKMYFEITPHSAYTSSLLPAPL